MKLIFTALLLLTTFVNASLFAASTLSVETHPAPRSSLLFQKKNILHDLKNVSGKKPGLKERIVRKLLEKRLLKKWLGDGEMTEQQKKQAKVSLILGISSLVLLLLSTFVLTGVGIIGLLSIPLAIIGLIFGIRSLKGNTNTQGLIGVITSSVSIALIILAVVILAILFANWE